MKAIPLKTIEVVIEPTQKLTEKLKAYLPVASMIGMADFLSAAIEAIETVVTGIKDLPTIDAQVWSYDEPPKNGSWVIGVFVDTDEIRRGLRPTINCGEVKFIKKAWGDGNRCREPDRNLLCWMPAPKVRDV